MATKILQKRCRSEHGQRGDSESLPLPGGHQMNTTEKLRLYAHRLTKTKQHTVKTKSQNTWSLVANADQILSQRTGLLSPTRLWFGSSCVSKTLTGSATRLINLLMTAMIHTLTKFNFWNVIWPRGFTFVLQLWTREVVLLRLQSSGPACYSDWRPLLLDMFPTTCSYTPLTRRPRARKNKYCDMIHNLKFCKC
jgi:hypothetical protein